jgi:hypothetical protein
VHWRYYNSELLPEFWSLVESLENMSRRWVGPGRHHLAESSLAGKYGRQLRQLHQRCVANPDFRIDVLGYSTSITNQGSDGPAEAGISTNHVPINYDDHAHAQNSGQTMPRNPVENLRYREVSLQRGGVHRPEGEGAVPETVDELSAISHMLMDQRFLEMDRIISFDEMVFEAQETASTETRWAGNAWS